MASAELRKINEQLTAEFGEGNWLDARNIDHLFDIARMEGASIHWERDQGWTCYIGGDEGGPWENQAEGSTLIEAVLRAMAITRDES